MDSDQEMNDGCTHYGSLFSEYPSSPGREDFVGGAHCMRPDDDPVQQPHIERSPIGPASRSSLLESQPNRLPDSDVHESDERVISLSLAQFVSNAKRLLEEADAPDVFCKFVLNGVYQGQQYQVDPIKDAVSADHHVNASRDYDSVLGLGKHIYLDCDIMVHPVCKLEDTLRRNIHIKHSFRNGHGEHVDIPVHRIPNLCIAKWEGAHNMVRAVIPGLYTDQRKKSWLEQEEYATFYEKGFRPAVEALFPAVAADWPPSYQSELFRARGKAGTLSFQTKTLGQWLVRRLGNEIRRALENNDVSWGKGLIFMYQIKGVKGSNGHRTSAEAAQLSLHELFSKNSISEEGMRRGEWWIDVGLEFSSAKKDCLAWRTDHHFHIVKNVLAISGVKAERITRPGSSKYIRDLTSHLTAVSGCRISPGSQAQGPHEAVYLQMYTTDKAVTYRPEGRHFGKYLTGKEVLNNKANDYCHGLYNLYRDASNKNNGHARVEVRVPLEHAARVLVDISSVQNTFKTSLVCVPSIVWWSLRAYRVRAFMFILEQQSLGTGDLRIKNSALLLAAAAPWFLNGLHSTPDNGPCSRDLMNKILPLIDRQDADVDTLVYPVSTRTRPLVVDEEEEEGEGEEDKDGECPEEDNISVVSALSEPLPPNPPTTGVSRSSSQVPYIPHGILFLRNIRMGEGTSVPRFQDPAVPMVSEKTLLFIFGMRHDAITSALFKSLFVVASHPFRVANKVRRTATRVPKAPEPSKIFNLSAYGIALPPLPQDTGSDIDSDIESERHHEEIFAEGDIDVRLSKLWRQFLFDITEKAPNRKGSTEASYCILTPDERKGVNDTTYRNLNLREYFSDCQYRNATDIEWASAFDKFWPEAPFVLAKSQNYGKMEYYTSWGTMVAQLASLEQGAELLTSIRRELKARFFKLNWIPNVQADRVWYTKPDKMKGPFKSLCNATATAKGPAPRILIRRDKQVIV